MTFNFDASNVDPGSVEFAGAKSIRWNFEDVNSDGHLDLLLHFKTEKVTLTVDSENANLMGKTYDNIYIQGKDTVNIVH